MKTSAQDGVRQFLDIGTGIPTEPNLHQIAQSVAPEARVVYADNDPIVLRHAEALLRGTPEGSTDYLEAMSASRSRSSLTPSSTSAAAAPACTPAPLHAGVARKS